MRMRTWVVAMTALLAATAAIADNGYPPRTGGNYSGPRWYGYFYNNNHVPENYDHTNITMVGTTELNEDPATQESNAITKILKELAVDQQYGERAMVDVEAIVFYEAGDSSNTCYGDNPNAAQDFQTLVTALEHPYPDQPEVRYLIPNDPVDSTVSSFYVADEPDRNSAGNDLCSLRDVYVTDPVTGLQTDDTGAAPALLDAISAIRLNADTTNFPLATIVTKDGYAGMAYGLPLFDWVGEDDYGNGVTDYLNEFAGFEYILRNDNNVGGTPQRYFLVPLVSYGPGKPYIGGAPSLYNEFVSDDRVIGIMPFKWDYTVKNADGTFTHEGMVATSSWAPGYIALGKSIATPHGVSPAEVTVIVDSVVLQ